MKNELDSIPFEEFNNLDNDVLQPLSKSMGLLAYENWLIPQLLAKFAEMKIRRNDEGKIIPEAFALDNFTTPRLKGMWQVACRINRGNLIKRQIADTSYCALVPLILAAFKTYHNIPYSDWAKENLQYVMTRDLAAAMTVEHLPQLSVDELLKFREIGRMKAGKTRDLVSCNALYNLRGTPLEDLPSLVKIMLTQVWVAHPSIRSSLMVLDPLIWDNAPDPLVHSDILKHTPAKKRAKEKQDLGTPPW